MSADSAAGVEPTAFDGFKQGDRFWYNFGVLLFFLFVFVPAAVVKSSLLKIKRSVGQMVE